MNYWIVINGNTVGPLTIEELRKVTGLSSETPVWYNGLKDWTTIGQLPDLVELLAATPVQPDSTEVAMVAPARPTPGARYGSGGAPDADPGEMPSTNLGWAIFVTICCCIPLGVVGIVYASKVEGLWRAGRYDEARKASEKAMWWTIGGFAAGLLWMPFGMLFQMMAQL